MIRLLNAFRNSRDGLIYVARHEAAFRLEIILFVVSVPVAYLLSDTTLIFLALTGSIILIMIVELLNTGIEAVCDGLSRDFMKEIKIAKDCGSAAVLLSTFLAGVIWLSVLVGKLGGVFG
ncbi:MAG: diacylglycerol kinase [Alphaproteobacteria bacterium]|nr:diacylglycerol kinase [Alphaproteobacteria bacterium]